VCDAGLTYLKLSVDSTTQRLRGEKKDFLEYGAKLLEFVSLVEQKNLKTKVMVTMIDLGLPNQEEEWGRLVEFFQGTNVYVYLKSRDQVFLDGEELNSKAIHWNLSCFFPWSSMTISASGKVLACSEDFNESLVMGDATKESLEKIWNGEKYREFRKSHLEGANSYCAKSCSMRMVGNG
jgi:radical SAM protein with 4Fe4S-binding SPASM domain